MLFCQAHVFACPCAVRTLHLLLLLLLKETSVASQPVVLTEAASAAELQNASANGAAHIVVTEHIDLRDVPAQAEYKAVSFGVSVLSGTQSISGRCRTAPARSDLAGDWVEGQCVLEFASVSAFLVSTSQEQALWLDHLYMRMAKPTAPNDYQYGIFVTNKIASLYLTNVTLEGVPGQLQENRGLFNRGTAAASGLQVLNFGPTPSEPCYFGAKSYLVNSRFIGNYVTDPEWEAGAGAIQISDDLKLERVTFANNTGYGGAAAYGVSAAGTSVVYSDASLPSYYSSTYDEGRPSSPLSAAPGGFPDFDDVKFVSLQDQVEPALLQAGLALPFKHAPAPGSASSPSSSFRSAVVIAGTVVGAVALVTCAVTALLVRRRYRRRRASLGKDADAAAAAASDTASRGAIAATAPNRHPLRPAIEWITMTQFGPDEASHDAALVPPPRNPVSRSVVADSRRTADKVAAASNNTTRILAGVLAAGASPPTEARPSRPNLGPRHEVDALPQAAGTIQDLEDALDDMHAKRQLLMGKWKLLSATHRRVGGQGLVQYIADAMTGEQLVAKFFLDGGAAFRREAELYSRAEVREMMAAVIDMQNNTSGELRAPSGLVLPPFIVLERGRSLDEWALVTKPDYLTSLQMLAQIVERLCALHACRLVHRDIKPANILWRTTQGAWTLIDFGCAVPAGRETSIACSMPYAPPEVAEALKDKRSSMIARSSMDIWALGVVTWELLVGERAFPGRSAKDIVTALTSADPLPWELGNERAGSLKKLGIVKRLVADCLNRNPLARPTAEQVLANLKGLFRIATSTQVALRPSCGAAT